MAWLRRAVREYTQAPGPREGLGPRKADLGHQRRRRLSERHGRRPDQAASGPAQQPQEPRREDAAERQRTQRRAYSARAAALRHRATHLARAGTLENEAACIRWQEDERFHLRSFEQGPDPHVWRAHVPAGASLTQQAAHERLCAAPDRRGGRRPQRFRGLRVRTDSRPVLPAACAAAAVGVRALQPQDRSGHVRRVRAQVLPDVRPPRALQTGTGAALGRAFQYARAAIAGREGPDSEHGPRGAGQGPSGGDFELSQKQGRAAED
mmetsp:Transcript_63236/g.173798  ORF Transcript_63236/g.173798 Transcript_63236/m.173798 type:complete len:266 (+) Transcript_63236:2600-3397(+)